MYFVLLGALALCGGGDARPEPRQPDKEFDGIVTDKGESWFEVKGTSGKVHHLAAGKNLVTKPDAPPGLNIISFKQIKVGQQLRVSVFIDKTDGAKPFYWCDGVILWGVKLGDNTLPPHGKPKSDE